MKNLLYKEFRLAISLYAFGLPVLVGALMLIPGWLYFIVFMYFGFITVPNLFASFKTQNDLSFTVMLPVSKSDIVKSRILAMLILELLHIIIAVVFAVINSRLYGHWTYFFLEPNVAFFGLVFIMFAIFNVILFPMYYKTGYKYGMPLIMSSIAMVVYAAGVELLAIYNSTVQLYLKGAEANNMMLQYGILVSGIVIFIITAIVAYKLSIKRFESVDI